MDDAVDLVAPADIGDRRRVGQVGLLDGDPLINAAARHRPALDQHARLARSRSASGDVRPDESEPAGYQDHGSLRIMTVSESWFSIISHLYHQCY